MAFKRKAHGSFGSSGWKRLAHAAGGALSTRLRLRNRGAGTQTRTGRRGRDTGATTRYDDMATLYRRKPAPRRVRNRVRKFAQRVQNVLDGEVALQVAVRPYYQAAGINAAVAVTSTLNTQAKGRLPGLYSCNGTTASAINQQWNDIQATFYNYYASAALANDSILEFTSACWDCKMYAESTNECPAFIDIYECVARKNYGSNADPDTTLSASMPTKTNFAGAGTVGTPGFGSIGQTPFDAPAFCELWKIIKVRRIKLEPGSTSSLQFRDPKHRKLEWQSQVNPYSWLRGVTRCWIPIVYGAPSSGNIATGVTVYFNCTRNYHFRQISNSTPGAGLMG